jgi:YD repeat-containing protein
MIKSLFDNAIYMFLIAAMIVLSVAVALAGSTTQRDAPTTRFYDARGNVTGGASTYGNTTRFYDARGNSIGTGNYKWELMK